MADFVLPNGDQRDSVDFLLQQQRAAGLRKIFGINPSQEPKLDWRQTADFRTCFRFLRERIWWLGAGEMNSLIDFVSLYTNTEKKPVFAQLSRLVLKEVCGKGKNFKELADSVEDEISSAAKQKTFQTLFYFWAATVHNLFPAKRLVISDSFDHSLTFARAKRHSELALGRAMTVLMMANEIVLQRESLIQMGVSPFQQETWLRLLLDKPRSEWSLTPELTRAGQKFRRYAPTSPGLSLERERLYLLLSDIPRKERIPQLKGILNGFVYFLNETEKDSGLTLDKGRLAGLRWWRQRDAREKTKILKAIAEKAGTAYLKDLFEPSDFRSSVRFNGQRQYSRRQDLKGVIPPLVDLLAESLEGRSLLEIMQNLPPPPAVALTFVENGLKNPSQLRPVLSALLEAAKINIAKGDCRLNKREILVALYGAAKRPFDGPLFVDTFRKVFFEDLPALDEAE